MSWVDRRSLELPPENPHEAEPVCVVSLVSGEAKFLQYLSEGGLLWPAYKSGVEMSSEPCV